MIHPMVWNRMLPTIVPLVCDWVVSVERDLWNSARPLTDQERAAAVQMGVQKPDFIRIAVVDELPEPSPELKHLAEQLRILTPTTNSLTYSHLIVIKRSAPHQGELVQHGLVHVLQVERCGSVRAFLREYFEQCLEYGKENCPMELEVRANVSRLCTQPNA